MAASLILLNGRVRTLAGDPAEAVACAGGRVLAVGDSAALRGLRGPATEVVDLAGRLVLPAFTDAHLHFAGFALARFEVDLKGVTALDEAARRVAEAAQDAPTDAWIVGRGWAHDLWGGQLPTRDLLDRAAPGRPVALRRNDGHGLWTSGGGSSRRRRGPASAARSTPSATPRIGPPSTPSRPPGRTGIPAACGPGSSPPRPSPLPTCPSSPSGA